MNTKLHLYIFLVTAMSAANAAPNPPASITGIHVSTGAENVTVEVDLSQSVTPTLTFAKNPDRLVADFPNVSPAQRMQRIAVGRNGIQRVRIGLNHSNPPITRVVIDLDSAHPFSVDVSGPKVLLNILSASRSSDSETQALNSVDHERRTLSIAETMGATPESETASTAEPVATRLTPVRTMFRVKGLSAESVYIDGGTNAGLQVGMSLIVRDLALSPNANDHSGGKFVAELRILAVATTSAVAEVREAKRSVKRGDLAELTPQDADAARNALENKALATVRIPGSSILPIEPEREARNSPTSSSPTSRLQGRVGLDYSNITSTGSSPGTSTQRGLSVQADMTNILGTHWNLQGYWRGRINRHSQFQEETIEETLNKTYTMQLYYDNPDSPWVAGVGRLYLPWAVSLDTIDGGYFGRKLSHNITAGVFAGSTPNITSWDYAPDHQISGSFVNFSAGSYDSFHLSSTTGVALSLLDWKLDRPYLFFENEASFKNSVSVYHSLIADDPRGVSTNGIRPGGGISRSYLTIHLQPSRRLYFDIYHNFFRDVPTALTPIVGTGLVDKLLFQGLNVGVHVEPIRHVMLYSTIGESEKTGDEHETFNQMYGITWSEILHSGVRADLHYSKFNSNFGQGDYRLLSISRQFTNHAFWNLQLGSQYLISPFTANGQSRFAALSMDVNLGKHSYLQSGYTFVDGAAMNYRQWYTSLGFRFDHGKPEAGEPRLMPK